MGLWIIANQVHHSNAEQRRQLDDQLHRRVGRRPLLQIEDMRLGYPNRGGDILDLLVKAAESPSFIKRKPAPDEVLQ